jgi:hypothetical protein
MRALKTRGGLSRGRGFTDIQQAVWLYSRNVCAAANLSLKNDFLGLNGGSSDQHVVIGKEYRKKNESDFDNTVEFFKSRNVFDISRTALLNIVTGIEAESSVNVHHAKSIGNKVVEKAVGCMVKSYKFKRVDQAITMGSKIKRQDGTVQEVDPQELFDRLINLAFVCSSLSASVDRLQLKDILCFELAPFPATLFENEFLMLKASKPQITDAFKKLYKPDAANSATLLSGISVVDGGSLLHTIPWTKRSTFNNIATSYVKYVKKHHLFENCNSVVVFDSYPAVPTTKDSTHLRRGESKSTNITIAPNILLDIPKSQFLSNPQNKQRFIDFLIPYLTKVRGISCTQADNDADTLIVTTAIHQLKTSNVTLYGDDTDLLALLLHKSEEILTTSHTLVMQSKVSRWEIKPLIAKLQGRPYLKRILALHALSGCDTTSRIFGKGKEKFMNISDQKIEFWQAVDRFYTPDCRKADIVKAGERILLVLYGSDLTTDINLDSMRIATYQGKSERQAKLIKAPTLPPTSDAAALHSLRCYLQVQVWIGNTTLEPSKFGFCVKNGRMLPITMQKPAAPDCLLDMIHCTCKGDCASNKCSCYKASLPCRKACTNCNGLSCENGETPDTNFIDSDSDDDTANDNDN